MHNNYKRPDVHAFSYFYKVVLKVARLATYLIHIITNSSIQFYFAYFSFPLICVHTYDKTFSLKFVGSYINKIITKSTYLFKIHL